MNNLVNLWTSIESLTVSREIEKLFALQGKPVVKSQVSEFVEELSIRNIPAGAVIAGIQKLKDQDLKTIKLSTILEASRDNLYREELQKKECQYCNKNGCVMVKTKLGESIYKFALACICQNGDEFKRIHGSMKWNGEQIQYAKIKNKFYEFRICDPDILKDWSDKK